MNNKSVLIGLSGGVDSAVAAHMLKKQGYDVHAVNFKISQNHEQSSKDAAIVADYLDIPLYIEDKLDEFERVVISYFTSCYIEGQTPNPCVLCNRVFKFKNLIEKADSLGIKYVATGHYANVSYDEQVDRYLLKRSANTKKDQSYFLYKLTQQQLSRILFPIADMNKDDVRQIAKEVDIPVTNKKDSQDICFISDRDYADFIKTNIDASMGDSLLDSCVFVDTQGKAIGRGKHHIFYTPGQRRGLSMGFNKRLYVLSKDAKNNIVTLSVEQDLFVKKIKVKQCNFVSIANLDSPMQVQVKIRNTMPFVNAEIIQKEDHIEIIFEKAVRAPANGQSAVFYNKDTIIGGGIIYGAL